MLINLRLVVMRKIAQKRDRYLSEETENQSMHQEDLYAILRAINRKRGGSDSLPKKALHKLVYRIQKKAHKQGLDVTVPYYWYMFGTVSPVSPSTVPRGGTLPAGTNQQVSEITTDVLAEYYAHDLEWLTDEMYKDAPYEVQREFRELDKQIRTRHPDYRDFYEVEPSTDSILESTFQVYDQFPTDVFSEWEKALVKWYNALTRELHTHSPNPEQLMKINLCFWRIISLEIAQEHSNGMTYQEIRGDLGINSFENEQQETLENLLKIEQQDLDSKFGDSGPSPALAQASDELIATSLQEVGIAFE